MKIYAKKGKDWKDWKDQKDFWGNSKFWGIVKKREEREER